MRRSCGRQIISDSDPAVHIGEPPQGCGNWADRAPAGREKMGVGCGRGEVGAEGEGPEESASVAYSPVTSSPGAFVVRLVRSCYPAVRLSGTTSPLRHHPWAHLGRTRT